MKDTILLTIGYDTYAIGIKAPAVAAAKLLEILSTAVEVRRNYSRDQRGETYRVQPCEVEVKVELIDRRTLVPPTVEDLARPGAIAIKELPGAMLLLGEGRR